MSRRRATGTAPVVARPVKTKRQTRAEWIMAGFICAVMFAPFYAWFGSVIAS